MKLKRPAMMALLALGAALAAGCGAAEETYKVSHVLPKDGHLGVGAQAFAEEVTRKTHGRIKIVHDPSVLTGEQAIVENLQIGAADFAYISLLGKALPESTITNLPFLFRDYAHARAVLDGPIGQELLDKFKSRGLVGLAWGENGFRNLTNNVRPIIGPEDVRGLRIRVQPSEIQLLMVKALGGEPKALPFNEVFSALQQGVVDAQENPIALILSNGYAAVQKYLTLTRHIYTPMPLLASEEVWNTIAPADQQIIREAARHSVEVNRAETDRLEKEGLAMLEKAGMRVTPTIDRAAFEAAVAPAYVEYARMFGQDVIDRIRNYKP